MYLITDSMPCFIRFPIFPFPLPAQADGIEIGWHRFVCSLEILDVVREKMRLPLPHVAYLQGDAGSEQVVSFDTYDTFFFYDAGTRVWGQRCKRQ